MLIWHMTASRIEITRGSFKTCSEVTKGATVKMVADINNPVEATGKFLEILPTRHVYLKEFFAYVQYGEKQDNVWN